MNWAQAGEYFQKYYNRLIWETIHARAHLKLWERLEGYKANYLDELNQAPHFFTYTLKAHLDDTLLTLSRVLDKHGDALSIWKFLDFVEQNLEIFSDEAFSQRMRGKTSYYEDLVKSHTPITRKEIEEDKKKLTELKNTINNLITWRDKVIAHIDRGVLLKNRIVSKEYPLRRQKLEEVIQALVGILNRYSAAYESSTFLEKFPGENDVQHVIDSIRFHIQERNKQIEELIKQSRDKG